LIGVLNPCSSVSSATFATSLLTGLEKSLLLQTENYERLHFTESPRGGSAFSVREVPDQLAGFCQGNRT
jgi:hypothetical protein